MIYTILLVLLFGVLLSIWIMGAHTHHNYVGYDLAPYFANIYVITIPNRRSYIENFCSKHKINCIMVNGINKDTINPLTLSQQGVLRNNKMNGGEIACYLSHLMVWKEIAKQRSTCLVLEDDVDISMYIHLIRNVLADMDKMDNEWDMFYLGRCWDLCEESESITDNIVKVSLPGCTHAYAVTPVGARKLISMFNIILNTLDRSIKFAVHKGILVAYASNHNMFVQNRKHIHSELGHEHETIFKCIDVKYEAA